MRGKPPETFAAPDGPRAFQDDVDGGCPRSGDGRDEYEVPVRYEPRKLYPSSARPASSRARLSQRLARGLPGPPSPGHPTDARRWLTRATPPANMAITPPGTTKTPGGRGLPWVDPITTRRRCVPDVEGS